MQRAGAPTIDELVVADTPEAWGELGFALDGDRFTAGGVSIRLAGTSAGSGLVGWSVTGLTAASLDGLPTPGPPPGPPGPRRDHPNTVSGIDHVVVVTPNLERTTRALEHAGLDLRRTREVGTLRQAFFLLADLVLEVVGTEGPDGPAGFWGITFVVTDIDGCARRLGERLAPIRDAVQPGRRIAPVRRAAGLALPVAFISPRGAGAQR